MLLWTNIMDRSCHGQNYWGVNEMLCSLPPDERLHKGFEGTGPGQCGGAAECPQVSLHPRGDLPGAANPSGL